MQLFWVEKFAGRGRRQFKSPRRINPMQSPKQAITVRPFRLPKDVEAAQPGGEGEASEKKNDDGPQEIIHPLPRPPIRRLIAEKFLCR